MNRTGFYIALLLLIGGGAFRLAAQCTFSNSVTISDLGSINIPIQISGAQNDDLSDPSQGVCGIEITFQHTMVGDLIMELVSPSGQTVTLVGPAGPFGSTDFTTWDITFVPCAEDPMPDPGFGDAWNNNQNWGVFGNYTGTYHPYLNCLEDFNTGPVNGEWTLFIQDGEIFDEGTLVEFNIIFCDDSGIECFPCTPNGGLLGPDFVDACRNSESLLIQPQLDFGADTPDVAAYNYIYLLSRNDSIVSLLDSVDLRAVDTGLYTVCGLSFSRSDSAFLTYIPGMSLDSLDAVLANPDSSFCGDRSATCIFVNVKLPPDTGQIERVLCRGDSFVLAGTVLDSPGLHLVRLDLPARNGCDSLVYVDLIELDPDTLSIATDTVSCGKDSAVLSAPLFPGARYSWNGPGGFTALFPDIATDLPGFYELTVNLEGSCSFSKQVEIAADTFPPDYLLTIVPIGCTRDTGIIRLVTEDSLVSWNGPGGFQATDPLIRYSITGFYTFNLIGNNGCLLVDSVFAGIDTLAPEVMTRDTVITCDSNGIALGVISPDSITSYTWEGPDGYQSDRSNPVVTRPGIYTVAVTGLNGCTGDDSLRVGEDREPPEVDIAGDSVLTCRDSTRTLHLQSGDLLDSVVWTLPDGSLQFDDSIDASLPGIYRLTAFGTNSCRTQVDIEVVTDRDRPVIDYEVDTLGCIQTSVDLSVQGPPSAAFGWEGPGGFTSDQPNPGLIIPGNYRLVVTGMNGCDSTYDFFIPFDSNSYDLVANASGPVTCRDPQATLFIEDSLASLGYFWISPGGDSLTNSTVTTGISGIWTALAIDSAGCTSRATFQLGENMERPAAQVVVPDDLPCETGSILIDGTGSSTGPSIGYTWSTPDGQINGPRNSPTVVASAPGTYVLVVEDEENGCTDTDTVQVGVGGTVISVFAGSDTLIPEGSGLFLTGNTDADPSILADQSWSGPAGQLCTDCPDFLLNPAEEGIYVYEVTDTNGCIWTDQLMVSLIKGVDIYVPNAFSPNGDGINDQFRPYLSGPVRAILEFRIFNRWGDKVFEQIDLPYDPALISWDGNFRGERAQEGTYVYFLRVQLINGTILTRKGELYLIR